MDCFNVCLNGLCLGGQGILHLLFVSRLTGKGLEKTHFAAYLPGLCLIEWITARSGLPALPAIGAEVVLLYGISRFLLKNRRSVSWVAAVTATYISQLSFGMVNSAEAILFPPLYGNPLLYPLVVLATLTALGICTGCYAAVQKLRPLTEDQQAPYVGLLLLPGLFLFAAEFYILQTAYHSLPASTSPEAAGNHAALLLLQILGLAALLYTLYAYRCICRGFQAQTALTALVQASQAQKVYIAEAKTRYAQTKAFRHDIKNHMFVLNGLLKDGKPEACRAYLQKLDAIVSGLSFPYRTGNPVVDILLGEKLRQAEAGGIKAEVSLLLPETQGIDELDLCVIFANALDNAISACGAAKGTKFIRISGKRQGDFYMISFENTCPPGAMPPEGTGLSNIRAAAEKYHGTMLTEKTGQRFSLHVLLNISGES